ncbi:MAG: hypothetical protein V1837_04105 [Candidatus Woesearchaeota archaeon]
MVSKVKQTILGVAIAIVLALFVGFSIHAVKPGPEYNDYCKNVATPPTMTEAACNATGGVWNPYPSKQKCEPGVIECPQGFCDMYSKCQKQYEDADKGYTKNVFIAATILGLIAVALGGFILKLESVSSGLMGGGVISIIYGIIRYWSNASNYLRVIILGLTLAILIWMGYKKLNPEKVRKK